MAISNEAAVRALIATWAKAVRDGDMEKMISLHSKDVVMFDVIPPFQIMGLGPFRKTWSLFFKHSPGGNGSFNISRLKITVSAGLAFATARLKVSAIMVRLTLGMVKKNGHWLIAHEHHSVLENKS